MHGYLEQDVCLPTFSSFNKLGIIPLMIPTCGGAAIIGTVALSCWIRFDCSVRYPTLSYAATFSPEKYVFMLGMVAAAFAIFLTAILFSNFAKIYLPKSNILIYMMLFGGGGAWISLSALAILDMKNYHDLHIIFTIAFFILAWIGIIGGYITRVEFCKLRHRIPDILLKSHLFGKVFFYIGLLSTATFCILFIIVNEIIIPNWFGFNSVHEAFAELLAVLCQLFFMASTWPETSILTYKDLHIIEFWKLLYKMDKGSHKY